jgi:hypothetical protein
MGLEITGPRFGSFFLRNGKHQSFTEGGPENPKRALLIPVSPQVFFLGNWLMARKDLLAPEPAAELAFVTAALDLGAPLSSCPPVRLSSPSHPAAALCLRAPHETAVHFTLPGECCG